MSDAGGFASAGPVTAGGLLRQARQARGMHIAALANTIKVVPRKLELLEADQFEQLPDATFTRALAQTVCRTLKVDPAPVLALLPPPNGHRLEYVAEGLKTPFHERSGHLVQREWAVVTTPVLWIAGLIGLATLAVYAVPASWWRLPNLASWRSPSAASASSSTVVTVLPGPASAPAFPPAAAGGETAPLAPSATAGPAPVEPTPVPDAAAPIDAAGALRVSVSAPSWVGVTDSRGRSLIARLVLPGEQVDLDGDAPFKVRVGNAAGTKLTLRGESISLAPHTRDNVARFDLK